MTWARFDDLYDDNRKVKRAWRRHPRAVGLHAMSITYSARHETDGLVDLEWLEEKLPKAAEREAVIKALVDCGLYEPIDGEHFRVHDYTDFNPSRADLESKRERDAARKRSPRGFHTDSTRSPNGIRADGLVDSSRSPNGPSRAGAEATPAARPVPTRPTPEHHRD